ncbi:MAG TPA: LysM peptidoglycan-binding domain-containing protein [Chloroflexota bacterium]|nr:LysM peptidoglycan-binding domain-containing protein [Chloroflexota bacterium]
MSEGNRSRRLSPNAFQPRSARVGADGSPTRWLRQLYTPRWRHHLAIIVAAFSIVPFTFHAAPQLALNQAHEQSVVAGPRGDAARLAVHYHTVAEGESLQDIADQAGLAVDTLRWANGLGDLDPIVVGQELLVLPTDGVLHYLASGETARQVALYYGADPDAVAAYNGVADPDQPLHVAQLMVPNGRPRVTQAVASLGLVGRAIVEGHDVPPDARQGASLLQVADKTVLVMDDDSRADEAQQVATAPAKTWDEIRADSERATAAALAASTRKSTTPINYTVQAGDTITGLADRYGVTPLTIIAANGLLDDDALRVGQELVIPPTTGVLYRVQEDDTLSEIAQRFRVDLGPIVDYNGLDSADSLSVGQRLVIPGAEPQRPQPPPPPPPPPAPAAAPAPGTGALASTAGPGGPNGYRLASATSAMPAPAAVAAPAARRSDPAPAPVAASSGKGGAIVSLAMQYLGYRYVFGGTTPAGFDCSGFVYYLHRQAGIPLSRGMFGQYAAGPHIPMNQLEPGDIVFFSNTYMPGLSHDGIYIGGGKFIHAADESTGVTITSLSSAYWASRYSGATRAH